MLVVQVIASEEAPHTQVELALPEGVTLGGAGRVAEADIRPGKPYQFRFPLRAKEPGAYIIGVKAMAGSESYRFGKSVSVAWIAQAY
jgi:hypothetical protein